MEWLEPVIAISVYAGIGTLSIWTVSRRCSAEWSAVKEIGNGNRITRIEMGDREAPLPQNDPRNHGGTRVSERESPHLSTLGFAPSRILESSGSLRHTDDKRE